MKNTSDQIKETLVVKDTLASLGLNGMHNINLSNSASAATLAASRRKLRVNTVLAATDHPKSFVYNIGGDVIDIPGLARLLKKDSIREEFMNIMGDIDKINKIVIAITGARYGVFSTNSDSVSFEMSRDRIEAEIKCSSDVVYALANVFTPLRTITGISAPSNSIKLIEAETTIYPTEEELVSELIENEIIAILNDINFDFLKTDNKSKIGVGDIASKYETAFYPLNSKFSNLINIKRSYKTVLSLVKSYVLNDYSQYSAEEIVFFEEERFLQLATNHSIVMHALNSEVTLRPIVGYPFWMQSIEISAIGIASSNKYNVVELNAVKEYYKISEVTDLRGFKKIVIISRNMREDTKLNVFRKRAVTGGLARLYPDITAENVLSNAYKSMTAISTATIHQYAHTALQNVANPESNFSLYAMNVPDDELKLLAMIFAKSVYIHNDNSATDFEFNLSYEIDLENSLIDDDLRSIFKQGLVTNPLTALFYAKSMEGKNSITVINNPIGETKHTLYKDIDQNLTTPLDTAVTFKMSYNGELLKPKWSIAELTGLVDLPDTYASTPIVGSIIFDQLMATHTQLVKLYREGLSDNETKSIGKYSIQSLNLSFIQLLLPIISTTDIDNLLSTAISQLWQERTNSDTRFGSSIFTETHLRGELRVRLVLFLGAKLGFITDTNDIKVILEALKSTDAFSNLLYIGEA